ncbi:MAG: hypothetical protein LBE55_04900 [Clostridiales bacterium]|nr:hypothetical protein [Clostridiales bacterium]
MVKKAVMGIFILTLTLTLMASCIVAVPRDMSYDDTINEGWVAGPDAVIEAGGLSSFVILPDGSLWGWGWNYHSQLGDGTTIDRYRPIRIMDDVKYVSVGGNHTVVIKTDGSLWSWGRNIHGQLGDGTIENRPYPTRIMDDVTAVSAGGLHTMAITADGSLWGWGLNLRGEVGDGTAKDQLYPVHIMDDVMAVYAGMGHTMAIKNDGSLWGWGSNIEGQVGDGTTENRLYPVRILNDVAYVSAGVDHTMAIKNDGSLWGWGGGGYRVGAEQNFGQIGDGERITRHNPLRVMDDVIQISAGGGHTMAIREGGSLWGWGLNSIGQVVDGTAVEDREDYSRPTPRKILNDVVAVSAGFFHNLAITSDGSLWSWGWNEHGQLGDGTTQARNRPVRIMQPPQ